jgi:superfamily II DNA or RNA helicase
MSTISISKKNEAYLKIDCDDYTARLIKKLFERFSPGYKFSPKFRECVNVSHCPTPDQKSNPSKCCRFKCPNFSRAWNGRISQFKLTNYLLPVGLYEDLKEWADRFGHTLTGPYLRSQGLYEQKLFDEFYKTIFENSEVYPRGYQNEAIKAAINKKIGIIEHGTGSGKTCVTYAIIRFLMALNKRVCIIVPNIMLVEQLKKEFKEYGWSNVEDYLSIMYTGNEPDLEKPVLVSTFQSLVKKSDSFISRYTAVMVDECHMAKAKSIKDILDKMIYADYRIGLTGSLPDADDKEEHLNLITIKGCLGDTIAQKPASELIDEGVLSDITIINMILKYPEASCNMAQEMSFDEEKEFINDNEMRYKAFDFVLDNTPKEENTLILCTELEYLDSIYKYVEKKYKDKFKVLKISGKIKIKERLKSQQTAEDESGVIIVATYGTLSTGVNIKRLHNLILASSYKSLIKVIQTLGRGLRKHFTKSMLLAYDLVDDLRTKDGDKIRNNYVFDHFIKRLSIYKRHKYNFVNKVIKLEEKNYNVGG